MSNKTTATWQPETSLRWRVPADTTTKPPILEQVWVCRETGEVMWKVVPTVVVKDQT
jgi:hypothetical protein